MKVTRSLPYRMLRYRLKTAPPVAELKERELRCLEERRLANSS